MTRIIIFPVQDSSGSRYIARRHLFRYVLEVQGRNIDEKLALMVAYLLNLGPFSANDLRLFKKEISRLKVNIKEKFKSARRRVVTGMRPRQPKGSQPFSKETLEMLTVASPHGFESDAEDE